MYNLNFPKWTPLQDIKRFLPYLLVNYVEAYLSHFNDIVFCLSVSYLSGDPMWRATSLDVVWRSYTAIDCINRSLAKFYPIFGGLALCTANIEIFRTHLTSTSSTISSTYSSQKRSLRWSSSKRKIMEVIEVNQLEDTNKERLIWPMPHSGLKPKNENGPKEEDDLDGRQPLTEADLWRKTTFGRGRPLTKDDLWRKTTFEGRRPSMEDELQ